MEQQEIIMKANDDEFSGMIQQEAKANEQINEEPQQINTEKSTEKSIEELVKQDKITVEEVYTSDESEDEETKEYIYIIDMELNAYPQPIPLESMTIQAGKSEDEEEISWNKLKPRSMLRKHWTTYAAYVYSKQSTNIFNFMKSEESIKVKLSNGTFYSVESPEIKKMVERKTRGNKILSFFKIIIDAKLLTLRDQYFFKTIAAMSSMRIYSPQEAFNLRFKPFESKDLTIHLIRAARDKVAEKQRINDEYKRRQDERRRDQGIIKNDYKIDRRSRYDEDIQRQYPETKRDRTIERSRNEITKRIKTINKEESKIREIQKVPAKQQDFPQTSPRHGPPLEMNTLTCVEVSLADTYPVDMNRQNGTQKKNTFSKAQEYIPLKPHRGVRSKAERKEYPKNEKDRYPGIRTTTTKSPPRPIIKRNPPMYTSPQYIPSPMNQITYQQNPTIYHNGTTGQLARCIDNNGIETTVEIMQPIELAHPSQQVHQYNHLHQQNPHMYNNLNYMPAIQPQPNNTGPGGWNKSSKEHTMPLNMVDYNYPNNAQNSQYIEGVNQNREDPVGVAMTTTQRYPESSLNPAKQPSGNLISSDETHVLSSNTFSPHHTEEGYVPLPIDPKTTMNITPSTQTPATRLYNQQPPPKRVAVEDEIHQYFTNEQEEEIFKYRKGLREAKYKVMKEAQETKCQVHEIDPFKFIDPVTYAISQKCNYPIMNDFKHLF